MNLNRLKTKNLLYVTEDNASIEKLTPLFDDAFKKVIYTKTYENIIENYFEKKEARIPIDLLLFDIKSSNVELLKQIRQKNQRIPIILISDDYSEIKSVELINIKVSYCINKEFSLDELLAEFYSNIKQVARRKFSAYIDQVAIVSRVDLEHNFIYINDMFANVSGYSKDEIIGKNDSILRYSDETTDVYTVIERTLSLGKSWHGVLKQKNITNDEFYVNTTIFPIFDHEQKVKEYLSIMFLVTNDSEKITQLKKYIISEKTKSMKMSKKLDKEIQEKIVMSIKKEQIKNEDLKKFIYELESELKKAKYEKQEKTVRNAHLESELSEIKSKEHDDVIDFKTKLRKLAEINRLGTLERDELNNKIKSMDKKFDTAQENISTLQGYIDEYRKKIDDLQDVINSNEKDIMVLKSKS